MEDCEKLRLALQEAESKIKRFEEIIALLPGHVYWKDLKGVILGCNNQQAIDAGYKSSQEMIGHTDYEMPWREDADFLRKIDAEVVRTGNTQLVEEKSKTIDGKEAIWLSRKAPLRNEQGNIEGVMGISLDITELKQAQENEKLALQKAIAAEEEMKRALLLFSGMQSHDLRTPLAAINMAAQLLARDLPSLVLAYEAAQKKVESDLPQFSPRILSFLKEVGSDILESVHAANEYISSSLQSITGAMNGDGILQEDKKVNCDSRYLLQRIVRNYPYKEISLRDKVYLSTSQYFNFKGNEIFFNRLVENLIKNAFEQIELKGRGEIFINCAQENQLNLIKIKDTAGGVTQEIIDKLLGGIKSSKQGGTGIGLSSAKQIMQGMNGDIKAYLVDGDCIEFVLSFPKI